MIVSDQDRLKKIIGIGEELLSVVDQQKITWDDVLKRTEIQWMITTPLYNIGEQVYCLSKEFKSEHPEINWSGVSGLRHRLIHDYEGISWSFVAEVLFNELQNFLEQVKSLRKS